MEQYLTIGIVEEDSNFFVTKDARNISLDTFD